MVAVAHSIYTSFASSQLQIAASRVSTSWPWYVIRAAGFTAAGLLFALMISGIGQVTGLTYKFLEPVKAWAVHKALAFALCGAIAIHGIFLLFDHFVSFSVVQILVPFASHYTNGTSLFGVALASIGVALGILAMYGVAVIVASSLGWIDTKQGTWRKLHYLSYFVVLAVFVHALGVGSDLKYGLFREAWMAVAALLVVAIASRLWRAGTLRRS
jgi:sulfoxide reductase heme-binding subunit YedZ